MDTLSEAKRRRPLHHIGILLPGQLPGHYHRSGMVAAGRSLVTDDGTDWRFPDELKRELKE